jgi:RNA polymerase sigma factor (sigma-70 family)
MTEEEFEALIEKDWNRLVDFANRKKKVWDIPTAQDIVQEKLTQLWESHGFLGGHGGRAVPYAWIRRCIAHQCFDFFRQRAKERRDQEDSAPIVSGMPGCGQSEDNEGMARYRNMAAERTLHERLLALPAALAKLPVDCRRVIDLTYQEDLTQEEIARRLGWNRWKVERTLRRAEKMLKALLTDGGGPDTPSGGSAGVLSKQSKRVNEGLRSGNRKHNRKGSEGYRVCLVPKRNRYQNREQQVELQRNVSKLFLRKECNVSSKVIANRTISRRHRKRLWQSCFTQ